MLTAIALGSNQGDLLAQFQKAADLLRPFHKGGSGDFLKSSIYRTSPVLCPPGSPDFYNAVVALNWERSLRDLLFLTQDIEYFFGRVVKVERNAPRPMDLDILMAGDCVVHERDLIVPHPRMAERRFVLKPLADILPEAVVPGTGETVRQLLSKCRDEESDPVLVMEKW